MKLVAKLKIPLFIIAFGIVISLFAKLVKITKIECFSQYGDCSPELIRKVSQFSGLSYDRAKNSIEEVLEGNPEVKKYSLHFKLPSALEVNVIEAKPKYALKNLASDTLSLVGENGKVLALTQETSGLATLVIGEELAAVSETVDSRTLFAAKIVYFLARVDELQSARLEDEKLIVELKLGPKVIFPLEGDKEILLGSYVLVMNELKKVEIGSKMKRPLIIDLRFRNPILKY